MEIGPQIPARLVDEDAEEYGPPPPPPEGTRGAIAPPRTSGPQLPVRSSPPTPPTAADEGDEEDEDEDAYVPALPPDLVSRPAQATQSAQPRRSMGPALLMPGAQSVEDSDEEVGPMPAPAGARAAGPEDAVDEFMAREERRAAAASEAANASKKPVREEWMLVPPSSSSLLGSLDPTKLKARQFSRSARPDMSSQESSLWTETPAERQARLRDEVHGKRRRATDVEGADADAREGDSKRRRHDEAVAAQVAQYNRDNRSQTLVDMHKSSKKDSQEKDAVIWDRERDMSVGGRLMDERQRSKMISEARGLGDRFGKGKSGGWL